MFRHLAFVCGLSLWAVPSPSFAAGPPTVAILYFGYEGKDDDLAQLRKGFAQMLITDVSANKSLTVVERDRIEDVIRELRLSQTDLVDPQKAVQVGRLVGAQRIVLGDYLEVMGTFVVNARMVETETGVIACAVGRRGKRDQFLEFESQLADALTVALLSDGTDCEKPRAGSAPVVPSLQAKQMDGLSMDAAADYSRALDAKDNGDREKAKVLLQAVVKEEPDFKLAQDELAGLMK